MSIDLLMYKGDLGLAKDKAGNYDLVLEEAGQSLLRRTVITPPSWIRMWVIEANQVNLLDDGYGDRIYLQLSDPLSAQWVSLARSHIQNSLLFIRDEENIEVTSLSIGVTSSNGVSPDTANIQITYTYEGKERTYSDRIKI